MTQFKLTDLAGIESQTADRTWLSDRMGDLIRSSLELEVKVFDRNPRTGIYVVVLEGRLESIGEQAGVGEAAGAGVLASAHETDHPTR